MLKGKNLSNEYWVEVVACVIYVINISPTKSVMNRVPEHSWSDMSCSVSHLIVFGCVAYAHVPKERRGKLGDKSEKCIFTGYNEKSKAYNLYNSVTKKTIISRDVVFKEKESWNGTVDNTVDAQVPLMEEDGVVEKEQQESRVKTPNKDTLTRTPRFSKQHGSSSRSADRGSPNNQSEAIRDGNWVQATNDEIEAIEKNDIWDLVDLPKDKNLIGMKWVYKKNLNDKGEIDRFKARLVAKGFS
eukprot:PITA_30095